MENTMNILTAEDIAFLQDLANELKTQERDCTGKPVFIQVRETKRQFGIDPAYSDNTALLIGDEYEPLCTVEEAKEWLIDYCDYTEDQLKDCDSLRDIERLCDDAGITSVYTGYTEIHEFHNSFLTLKGYEQHMKLNRHNYRNGPEPYINHAFRNPELQRLLEIVERFATVKDGD